MGKLVIHGVDYGNGDVASIAYVSERAVGDLHGNPFTKEYLRASSYFNISGVTELEEQPNAGFHNSFYRGKDITSKYEDGSLYEAIKDGSFTDLFVGDYINVPLNSGNPDQAIIAGFDIYLHNGDTELTDHHAVMIARNGWGCWRMNETDTTVGAYNGCYLHLNVIPAINDQLGVVFGDHVVEHKELLTSTISAETSNASNPELTGCANNWTWTTVKACLMTEVEVLGSTVLGSSGYDVGTGKVQLPFFRFDDSYFNGTHRTGMWTRTVASSIAFNAITNDGISYACPASDQNTGVFPRWLIKG